MTQEKFNQVMSKLIEDKEFIKNLFSDQKLASIPTKSELKLTEKEEKEFEKMFSDKKTITIGELIKLILRFDEERISPPPPPPPPPPIYRPIHRILKYLVRKK